MSTYLAQPEFRQHPQADWYRGLLERKGPLAPGVLREGMLPFTPETACCWGGPYPVNAAHFMLLDQRDWTNKWSGRPLAEAREEAMASIHKWLTRKPRQDEKAHYQKMLARIEAWDADVIHQVEERGTQEYPIRIWVLGNDDTSYSKWFKTVEDAEALLSLLEGTGPLDFGKDFLVFDWTFTN